MRLAAPPGGKRQRQAAVTPPPPAFRLEQISTATQLLYVHDDCSGFDFLVDTGAAVSLFPHSSKTPPSPSNLRTADGSPLPTWGTRRMKLNLGGKEYAWNFLLAPVDRPILGWDFLSHFRLIVDAPGARLLNSNMMAPICVVTGNLSNEAVTINTVQPPAISALLNEFQEIFGAGFSDIRPTLGVEHHITTRGPPVHARARRLEPAKLAAAKAEFLRMEQAGVIRRSNSPWASPLHMVPKDGEEWRPCGDYRTLNAATVPDTYPLPHVADLTAKLHGKRIFSKIDLLKGFYQIPMHPADVPKTCVVTPFGAFEWLFMPFGLRNAAQTFQRCMDQLLADMDSAFIYLDDVLVASATIDEHIKHLRELFLRLRNNGFKINRAKCIFAQHEVPFLGHTVSESGIRPLPRHVDAVAAFPPPADVPALQRFLGLVNFFRRFIPGAAGILRPLTDSLKTTDAPFQWTPAMQTAFEAAKSALASACSLRHPIPDAKLSLAVDASASHVGAALQQMEGGGWAPLAFFSRKLLPAETKYSAFDRELLAAYSAIKHFRHAVEGREFTLYTDHKPLVHAMQKSTPPDSNRQQRHLSYISEYTTDLQYLPGVSNVAADALSRPVAALLPDSAFVDAQKACIDCNTLAADDKFQVRPTGAGGALMSHASPSARLLVPSGFRRRCFEDVHNTAHPGTRATRRLLSRRFLWTGMKKDVALWVKECLECQKSKITRHQHPPVEQIPIPARRFTHVHLDLVGPLQTVDDLSYILTMVDRTTRWAEAVPLKETSTATCIRAFLDTWVSRFGVPTLLTTDQGAQFTSSLWQETCEQFGIEHRRTSPYHPQSNGMVERFHRRLKDALRAKAAATDWPAQLPLILLSLRSAPAEGSGISSAELVYGSTLSYPSSFLDSRPPAGEDFHLRLQRVLRRLPPLPTRPSPAPVWVDPALQSSTHVFVRRDGHVPPLEPLYDGPFAIVQKDDKVFTLQIGGRRVNINVERLKPVHASGEVTEQQPPRRGRPPRRAPPRAAPAPPALSSWASPAPPATRPPTAQPPRRRGRPPRSVPGSATRVQPPTPPPSRRPGLRPRHRAGGWGGGVGNPVYTQAGEEGPPHRARLTENHPIGPRSHVTRAKPSLPA